MPRNLYFFHKSFFMKSLYGHGLKLKKYFCRLQLMVKTVRHSLNLKTIQSNFITSHQSCYANNLKAIQNF